MVAAVLDYPEKVTKPGLNLLMYAGKRCVCRRRRRWPAGANVVLFTTGLGTPTGNPVVPVVKIASNTALFERMRDIIDINTGTVIRRQADDPAGGSKDIGLCDRGSERGD